MGVPVYVENDAGCAALAEASEGGKITVPSLIMLTIGTGVGGGWVLNGRLYRGATTSAAEVGHTIIGRDLTYGNRVPGDPFPQRGSLETMASGRALDRLADHAADQYPDSHLGKALAKKGSINGHDVVQGAEAGDPASLWCLRVLGERIGVGIANAINTFDPLEVVHRRRRVAGGRAAAGTGARRGLPPRRARAGAEHHDSHRAARPTRGCARGGADRRPGVRRRVAREDVALRGGLMKIACAFDHAGFPLKPMVLEAVAAAGHEVQDLGTWSTDPVDYPDTARLAAEAVRNGDAERAVLVCGSGAGVAVAACKFPNIRAVVAHDTYTAHQSVEHDDCNVLCLGGRVIGPALAADIIRAYLGAEFTGEDRHKRRLAKIDGIEREFLRDDI